MSELNVSCSICLDKYENETSDEALGRLKKLLDSELCTLADHHISYQIHEVSSRRDDCEPTTKKGVY